MGNKSSSVQRNLPNDVKKIVCVHLFNDFSGSPLILSEVIKGLGKEGFQIDLFTSAGTKGFLSNLNVNYKKIPYRFYQNILLRIVFLFYSQFILFLKILKYKDQKVVIYINTLLPFGAALAGKLIGKPVVYHVHESSLKPAIFKNFLKTIASRTASDSIFVSNWLKETEQLAKVPATVVYNGLSDEFIEKARKAMCCYEKSENFSCLMLSSLKEYKGVREYVELAKKLSHINFELVLNANQKNIDAFFAKAFLPSNLNIYPTAENVHPFYAKAHVVLNLSHPEQWIETFGMTLLEAMCYGLPCIGPNVGGPMEIIQDGKNGYSCDQRNQKALINYIRLLAQNKKLYRNLSDHAKSTVLNFSGAKMINGTKSILGKYFPTTSNLKLNSSSNSNQKIVTTQSRQRESV